MNIDIYYFSGTGNSLFVAKEIARKTNGSLHSIAIATKQDKIRPQADAIGIVFPCYLAQLHGIPLVVENFVRKLEVPKSKYVFAVCTCGGYTVVDSLPTLKRLESLIKSTGGHLSGIFSVRLPMNNLNYFFFQTHNHEKMYSKSEKIIDEICDRVLVAKRNRHYLFETVINTLLTPLYLLLRNFYIMDLKLKAKEPKDTKKTFHDLIPLTDNSIFADDKCAGCATCVKVCPVNNIVMINDRPVWQNSCEMCMACVAWCPQGAVHHWNIETGKKYHHPGITLNDLLVQSGYTKGFE